MNQRLLDGDLELAAAGSNLSLLGGNDSVANWGDRDGHAEDDSDELGAAGGVGAGIQYDLFQDENNLLRCESMMLPRKPSFVERRVHPYVGVGLGIRFRARLARATRHPCPRIRSSGGPEWGWVNHGWHRPRIPQRLACRFTVVLLLF